MQNQLDMHLGTFQFISRKHSTRKLGTWEWLGLLKPVKEVTEWVNSFVIMEKNVPVDSINADHSSQKKLPICLDPRDLNEALE